MTASDLIPSELLALVTLWRTGPTTFDISEHFTSCMIIEGLRREGLVSMIDFGMGLVQFAVTDAGRALIVA